MMKLHLIRILLALSGIIHFMDPYSLVNALPPFVPSKLEIIYFTGILEWILVAGLSIKNYRTFFATITAIYFVFLTLIQIYVAINAINLFDITDPILLWIRAIFHIVLTWWAFSLKKD